MGKNGKNLLKMPYVGFRRKTFAILKKLAYNRKIRKTISNSPNFLGMILGNKWKE